MSEEPASNEQAKPEQEDPFERIRREVADFHGYDEVAMEQFQTLSFYFAQRRTGVPLPTAATMTCQNFGHDAPRGLCRRCGLGIDLEDQTKQRQQDRVARRDEFLATRRPSPAGGRGSGPGRSS